MKIRLTAKKLESLQSPNSARTDYYDVAAPGLIVRVSPPDRQGRVHKTFIGFYYHKGRQRRVTLGTCPPLNLADGRDLSAQARREAALGRDPAKVKQDARTAETFDELAREFLSRYSKNRNSLTTQRDYERMINNTLIPAIGKNTKAADVTRADVRRLLDEIVKRGSPYSANRTLACLRKIYNWGMSVDIVDQNPCHQVSKPAKERRRDRVFTEDEIKTLWKEFGKELSGPVFKLLLLTAQRSGEVRSMQWSEIDLDSGWWTIPAERAKNGITHRVPLSGPALRILEEIKKQQASSKTRKNTLWVFPAWHLDLSGKPQGTIQKTVETIRKRCSVTDFRAHDLRRTAASHMTSTGIQRLTVSKILNHAEPGVTAVYDRHSYDPEKRQALDAWARKLMLIISDLKEVTA